jgi:hypothetical protein
MSEDTLARWLATVDLPPGPLEILGNVRGFQWRALIDPEVWRRACLRDLFPPDRPSGETLMPHVADPPEVTARRRRCLLHDIARVREALRLGRPLTASEDAELRR